MSDIPPPAGNNTPENQPPKPHKPTPLNAAQLASLTKTESICRVALQPAYLARLITELDPGEVVGEDDITEESIVALQADCATVRNTSGEAVIATGAKHQMSQAEIDAEAALMVVIQEFQARARTKYHSKSPTTLKDFGIGETINANRETLEQWAQIIYNKTATDKLPKINAARRQALLDALAAYKTAQTAQGSGQSTATNLRVSRDTLLDDTVAGRMKIQFAAQAEWPHTAPANHAARMEFQLPATRPFVG